jgi:hypothetical protein
MDCCWLAGGPTFTMAAQLKISHYEAHFALFTYFSECDLLILVDKIVNVN